MGQQPKSVIIVEEIGPDMFRVRRTKNWLKPLVGDFVVGKDLKREQLETLNSQGVEVVVDQPGYKRRWTP